LRGVPRDGRGGETCADCAVQCTKIDVTGHFGAAVADTSPSLPAAMQANTEAPAGAGTVDAAQCTRTDLAAHFRVALSDTWVSRCDIRQA
jgi:hypothetical protein